MTELFHHVLRTSDVAAAQAFYAAVLEQGEAEIFPLHEQAVARGARPHWLGFVEVADVAAQAASFAARGATALGPKWVNPQGLEAVVVRDPGGAVVALGKPPPALPGAGPGVSRPRVVWHLLHTADVERARENYRELAGWEFKPPLETPGHGVLHPFSWQPGGAEVGWLSDTATRPGVHPHWLFHFRVASLAAAVERVHAGGGSSLGPFVFPKGARVAVCDDPQGAAFALLEGPT